MGFVEPCCLHIFNIHHNIFQIHQSIHFSNQLTYITIHSNIANTFHQSKDKCKQCPLGFCQSVMSVAKYMHQPRPLCTLHNCSYSGKKKNINLGFSIKTDRGCFPGESRFWQDLGMLAQHCWVNSCLQKPYNVIQ